MAIDPVTMASAEVAGHGISSAANFISAERQMIFQRKMAGSRHQRTVRDLKKAGLNPILSVTQGATPPSSGSSARASSPQLAQLDVNNATAAKLRADEKVSTKQLDVQLATQINEMAKSRYNSALATGTSLDNQKKRITGKGYEIIGDTIIPIADKIPSAIGRVRKKLKNSFNKLKFYNRSN